MCIRDSSDIVPVETIMTVVARHFALMTEAGYENMTPSCITSFGIYTEILETWHHHPEVEEKIREYLWKATKREFKKPKNLAHTSDIIYKFRNEIAAQAKYKLVDVHTGRPLRGVEHIGCHYSKMFPTKGIGGAEFPAVLSGMIYAWGGDVIDYPERRHCCGFGFRQYLVMANRGYSCLLYTSSSPINGPLITRTRSPRFNSSLITSTVESEKSSKNMKSRICLSGTISK